ncbi:hypothetical protein J6590_065570 [Homalodisca vitripennis]|nr:hypothetical protein J6590_065570 [Homalodisca vitripennis]
MPAVMRLDGVEVEGAAQIAEKFAQYFSSVYGHCQLDSEELWRRALRSPVMPGVPTMTLGSVTRSEMQQALLELKPKTSVGPDGLPPYIFKACSELRRVAMLVCLYKLVGGVLDDSALLSKLQFSVPRLNSRSRLLFSPPYSRTNLAANSPLNVMIRLHNSLPINVDIFGNSLDQFIQDVLLSIN